MAVEALEMSAEAEELPEAVSGSGTLGIIRGSALRTPPPPSSFLLQPRPSLPSSACWAGTHSSQQPQGGKEGRWGLGGGLPPGNVTLPGPRIAPGPKPRARPGTQRRGSAGWGYFYLLDPLLGTTPHLIPCCVCSLTLEFPTHPSLTLSPAHHL